MHEAPRLIGNSPLIQRLRDDIRAAARTDAKVLITGESGVGKEIVSRLIHAGGPRSTYQLITVNCAAITETLLESELFGHERGSFTGAYRDRVGVLEMAHRGTVFMDEIGETSPRMPHQPTSRPCDRVGGVSSPRSHGNRFVARL